MVAPAYVVLQRRLPVRLALATTIAGAALFTASCSSPVAVQAPTMTAQCEDVISNAPIRLLGELQRETSPADAAAIAWGDPPIVLTCGGAANVPEDAQVLEVNGIEWVVESSDAGTVFTTYTATPTLQVRVPVDYRPEIDAIADLDLG